MKKKRSKPLPWVPDWRNSENYPSNPKTDILTWVWEFLRRNPEYQSLYEKKIRPYKPEKSTTEAAIYKLMAAIPKPVLDEFEQKFNVKGLPSDPESTTAPLFNTYLVPCVLPPYPGLKYDAPVLGKNEVYIKFALDWPLLGQVKRAKSFLANIQKTYLKLEKLKAPKRKYDSKFYRDYLRVLDADSAGIPHKEIAKVIFPNLNNAFEYKYHGNKQVESYLKLAKAMRDKHYRFLAAQIY